MRFRPGFILLAVAVSLGAQSAGDPEVARARAEVERLRGLVKAGAAPRLQLEKAETAIADAEDEAFLRKTLYGQDLTEAQTDEMRVTAQRRFERRQKAYEDAQKLVAAGAASPVSVDPLRREMERARKECDLAESRATLTHELAQMARTEAAYESARSPLEARGIADRFDGNGVFTTADFDGVETAFERQFGKVLPVSAMGQTAVHNALGFDHRGRVDVALAPDAPEGEWLRAYLMLKKIPFFTFRQAVPGRATGAHIHIGPLSGRLASGG
jgi:hypothetical protein